MYFFLSYDRVAFTWWIIARISTVEGNVHGREAIFNLQEQGSLDCQDQCNYISSAYDLKSKRPKKKKISILSKSTRYKITLPLVLSRNAALEIRFWYSLRVVVTDTEILCCGFEIDNLFSPDLCGRCRNAKEEKKRWHMLTATAKRGTVVAFSYEMR